jgi:diaminohydroxyphosphoribosylaminopyrimidine deaminase/5-amino-6-(5-phosphoribosylamino)uracil reductase
MSGPHAVERLAWMGRALELARRGATTTFPNPRVGAVVVRDGAIVGEGWHRRAGEPHAEIFALRAAGDQANGADLYVTLEPCSHQGRTPPCVDAVVASGVCQVFVAMGDPNPLVAGRGIARLQAQGIDVRTGLLQAAALELNRGFVSRMTRGRPHVTLKLGASLDGRTAMASGESQWITGDAARVDVHRLRAEAGAVLTSSATVLADDPALTVRSVRNGDDDPRPPDRIVLDARERVPETARVWADDGARRFRVVGPGSGADAFAGNEPAPGVAHVSMSVDARGRLDLEAVLAALGRLEVNSVLVESGPILAGALLRAGLVDELVVYLAPNLLGDQARGLARVPGLERLADRITLRFADVRQVGPDLRITAVPAALSS